MRREAPSRRGRYHRRGKLSRRDRSGIRYDARSGKAHRAWRMGHRTGVVRHQRSAVLSLIEQAENIEKILAHLGLRPAPAHSPPLGGVHDATSAALGCGAAFSAPAGVAAYPWLTTRARRQQRPRARRGLPAIPPFGRANSPCARTPPLTALAGGADTRRQFVAWGGGELAAHPAHGQSARPAPGAEPRERGWVWRSPEKQILITRWGPG